MSSLVQREPELEVLSATLRQAAERRARVVLIEGGPGVGKTTLLRQFVAALDGVVVLHAIADKSEGALPFGLIGQMRDVSDAADFAAQVWAEALDDALGPPAPEPFVVGAALLDCLRRLQDAAPVMLVVDDANLADIRSQLSLLFALRRLHQHRVLGVLTCSYDPPSPLVAGIRRLVDGDLGVHLRVDGLSNDQVQELSSLMGAGALSPSAAHRLRAHTGGNPRHIKALIEEAGAESLRQPSAVPIAAPRAVHRQLSARMAGLSPATSRLLSAAAVVGERCPLGVARRLARVEEPLVALQPAVDAELIAYTERHLVFVDPLVRSCVYHATALAERAALHAAAAVLVDDERAALAHRVAAATEPDDGLSGALAGVAERESAAGSWSCAASAFAEAARLATARGQREEYVVRAVECLLAAGDTVGATRLDADVGTLSDEARACYVDGRLAEVAGRTDDAERLLVRAFELCSSEQDAAFASRIAYQLAALLVYLLRPVDAGRWRARAASIGAPGAAVQLPAHYVDLGLAVTGRDPPDGHMHRHRIGRAIAHVAAGAYHRACEELERLISGRESLGLHASGLLLLSLTKQRLGAWDDAIAHAEHGVSVTEEARIAFPRAALHLAAAGPLAARGQWNAAEGHARRAAEAADGPLDAALATSAQVVVARARGAYAVVLDVLDELRERGLCASDGDLECLWPWRELYVEAAIGTGRLDVAEPDLQRLERLAASTDSLPAMASAARLRGTFEATRGAHPAAHTAFRHSIDLFAKVSMPFDRALAHAAHGAFLRRAGKRSAAVAELRTARAGFGRLGANPYVELCDRELASAGLTPRRRRGGQSTALTPQEMAVARLVAEGKSNRAVASELVLSVNTIEYHLKNIYNKLGISSRSQLILRLRDSPDLADAVAQGTG